jgi:8-oxo-dGTP pyrophosphatase MutT (NUDIX family)
VNKNAGRLGTGGGPQQAAAIAFRGTDRGVEVCLIRKRNSQTWGIPKGMVDPGDTLEETALNETWEEAGMDGRLVGAPVGKYEYEKWESTFTVAVYLLEVLDEHPTWPEERFRERGWWPLDDAVKLLSGHPVRPLLGRVALALTAWRQGR